MELVPFKVEEQSLPTVDCLGSGELADWTEGRSASLNNMSEPDGIASNTMLYSLDVTGTFDWVRNSTHKTKVQSPQYKSPLNSWCTRIMPLLNHV